MGFLQPLVPYLAFCVYTLLKWTWRVEIHESEGLKKLLKEKGTFVVAHWHGEELGLLHLLARYHVACMVSTSKDGDIVETMIRLSGSRAVRGSSTRGAVQALKGIIRIAREGWRPSVAIDGPRGPRHEVKLGVIEIAKVLKVPVVPITMASSPRKIFEKSWNKIELPLPFSRIAVTWGEPIPVDPERPLEDYKAPIAEALHAGRRQSLERLKS